MRRRNFLKNIAGAGVAGLGLSSASTSAASADASAPQSASGPFKKGVNTSCFPARTTPREMMQKAKQFGFQGVELQFSEKGEIGMNATADDMRRLADEARSIGVEIAGLVGDGWSNPLTAEDPATRDRGKQYFRKSIELAGSLGVDSLLVVPGTLKGRGKMACRYEQAWQRATEAIRELVPLAEKHNVCLSIENVWNNFLLSPLEMRSFIDQFKSPFVKSHLDLGNMILYGYAQDWVLTLGPRIKHVHVKDFNSSRFTFVNLLEGDVDWPASMAALREVGYRGFITAELSPNPAAPDLLLANTVKAMDYIFAM